MSLLALLPIAPIGLLVGVLIGCLGVGGVLLVPSLTYLGGVPVHSAIAACMFSYLFSGAAGALAYARAGSIRWSMAGALCAGAVPGAFAGAAAMSVAPGRLLELVIATLVLFSGLHALRGLGTEPTDRALRPAGLALIGAVTGIGSAMSGTGGPLILVPLLVWLGVPALTAVGLSQVIQLPVAAFATAGNLAYGAVDLALGAAIAVLLVAGVAIGARVAHRVPADRLRALVAWTLVVVGLLIAIRMAHGWLVAATA